MAEKKILRADGTPVEPKAQKKVTRADDASAEVTEQAAEVVEAAAKPAEKKKKKADTAEAKPAASAQDKAEAKKYRIGAIVLWAAAIVFEVLAVLVLFGKIAITSIPTIALIIVALVLDLACVSVGSTFWKKANHIDPASKADKVKFWLWNNMGLIVTAFAFIPFIILTLTNKNADKKTKTIATVVAVIALLIGGLISYDFNPISLEEKNDATAVLGSQEVYWTQFGKVYHTSQECGHLNNSDTIYQDTVDKAIEANKVRICKDCAKRDNIETDEDGYVLNKGNETEADADLNADLELPVLEAEENEAA